MNGSSTRQKATVTAIAFGIIPCILGVGIGQYLRWSGAVWLTSAGGFWPVVCFSVSVAVLTKLAVSPFDNNTNRVGAWLVITWTWLYFPFWLTAAMLPQSSAVINRDGRVFIASEWARQPEDTVWLFTGRTGKRIVRNVAGTVTINAVEVRYRYAERYIATRSDEEDLSKPVIGAAKAILAVEAAKSRSSRIALFETHEVHARLLADICRAAVRDGISCPLQLGLSPQSDATTLGAVWSKYYTEKEAIDEKHLPTLVQLLTNENSRLVDRDRVFEVFMALADTVEQLSRVAQKSHVLNEYQFDELIKRMLAWPGGGNEAVSILSEGIRLKKEQRQELRTKMLREASIAIIAKNAAPLHISDAEIAQLDLRMRTTFEANPDVAVLALETFGERLPTDVQQDAVKAVVSGRVSHALDALRHLNFSTQLREKLLTKIMADANYDDFDAAHLSRDKLEEMLTPAEMRSLIASVIRKSESSTKWLNFAVRALPMRAMTIAERKTVLNGLLFESAKSALEFVSENRAYLEAGDVNEVTVDYTRTITPDLCLHLSHRNTNRRVDYFSDAQLQIFRSCAQSK